MLKNELRSLQLKINDIKDDDMKQIIQFKQQECFEFKYDRDQVFLLDKSHFHFDNLPFPDCKQLREKINSQNLTEEENQLVTKLQDKVMPGLNDPNKRCKNCGAVHYNTTVEEKCCNNIPNIKAHFISPGIPQEFIQKVEQTIKKLKNDNISRIINWMARPLMHQASINNPNAQASTSFMNGVAYIVDSEATFLLPAYLIANGFDKRGYSFYNLSQEETVILHEIVEELLQMNPKIKEFISSRSEIIKSKTQDYLGLCHVR
ncbi:hypothetical protein TVAG_106410 [Trichomonas vaginalis G3]|uniref:Uncharacterized protein n=1 Tax=Trichomonas vaginalis (strain ATCC PRA-98 / G3) TaxID=412133 RepID=A2E6D3_TRIV3|nr:hypothetical protein TVAGG3_0039450 [Trichomonas vaginalis G3]EAY11746.1 hypothetical protein TVAG_106410 [Trichomonas vaginalis G3]KAI5540597.1 hypothetical protein TVAGG3_0039450 [Trichomonas vaginalis G3]|eukprot:XP_001323969.1 hypothetical protein [Trichomonas vaginalis G3]